MTRAWRLSSGWYGFFFAAMGAHLPFWPLWLKDWGLSEAEVGVYTASAIAARVVFGVAIPWVAERLDAPRRSLAALAAFGALLFAAHLWVETRPLLFLATLATAAVTAGLLPVADALSLRAAAREGFSYAGIRSVGSAAFLAANLICGLLVAAYGSVAALWWIALAFVPLIWLGLRHPGGAGRAAARPRFAEAARLCRNPVFIVAMVASAAPQASHAVLYAYGSIHWRGQGLSEETIGALWAFGVAVEVAVMAIWGGWLMDRLGAAALLGLASLAGVLRWTAMLWDPGLIWLWPLQAMHGLTFTAAHLGVMAFVRSAAPDRLAATAQGLTGALAGGVAMAAASFLAARVYPEAAAGAFWISIAFSALGFATSIWLARIWRGGELDVGGEAA